METRAKRTNFKMIFREFPFRSFRDYNSNRHVRMLCSTHPAIHLLPDSTLVKRKLFSLKHIPIHTATLPRPRSHHCVQTTSLELPLQLCIDLANRCTPSCLFLLHTLALFGLLALLLRLCLTSPPQALPVVCLVPLTERCGVDLDDGGFGKRIRADELVVRRMEGHANDADFAGYAFRAPGEVARFEAEGTIFGVTTTGADEMDTLSADTGVGWLATLLKSSVSPMSDFYHLQNS